MTDTVRAKLYCTTHSTYRCQEHGVAGPDCHLRAGGSRVDEDGNVIEHHPGHGGTLSPLNPANAKERQAASRVAMKMNRRAKVAEDQAHAADVWRTALETIGVAGDETAVTATVEGITRAADTMVAAYLAVLASGDPQFAPAHGKEAAEMMKAVSMIGREYRARQQLDQLKAELANRQVQPGTIDASVAGKITELVTKLQARAEGA